MYLDLTNELLCLDPRIYQTWVMGQIQQSDVVCPKFYLYKYRTGKTATAIYLLKKHRDLSFVVSAICVNYAVWLPQNLMQSSTALIKIYFKGQITFSTYSLLCWVYICSGLVGLREAFWNVKQIVFHFRIGWGICSVYDSYRIVYGDV